MRKPRQNKLNLTSKECSLIKGLIEYTDLNDQSIVAIFSHKSRSINHREVGYFRDPENKKYSSTTPASKENVNSFLKKYAKFENVLKTFDLIPKEACFQQLQKATEAVKTAISIYNNPQFMWKSEICIVNMIIGWTYLTHAYFLTREIDYSYDETIGDSPKLWELSKCIKSSDIPLNKSTRANLRFLIELRNEIEHRLSDNIDSEVAPKLQACALNFNKYLVKWFGENWNVADDLGFAIQFAKISMETHRDNVENNELSSTIKAVNAILENDFSMDDLNSPEYSYSVWIVPKTVNNSSKAMNAASMVPPDGKVDVAIKEVERKKYLPSEIVAIMKSEGYEFDLYGKKGFVNLWKELDAKKTGKGYGVKVASSWYWYESFLDKVRECLRDRKPEASSE